LCGMSLWDDGAHLTSLGEVWTRSQTTRNWGKRKKGHERSNENERKEERSNETREEEEHREAVKSFYLCSIYLICWYTQQCEEEEKASHREF
jgi:hypothetical protein